MPNNHPYDKKSDRRQQDLNDLVDGAVNFGLGISSTVLSGIAGALDSVGAVSIHISEPTRRTPISYAVFCLKKKKKKQKKKQTKKKQKKKKKKQ